MYHRSRPLREIDNRNSDMNYNEAKLSLHFMDEEVKEEAKSALSSPTTSQVITLSPPASQTAPISVQASPILASVSPPPLVNGKEEDGGGVHDCATPKVGAMATSESEEFHSANLRPTSMLALDKNLVSRPPKVPSQHLEEENGVGNGRRQISKGRRSFKGELVGCTSSMGKPTFGTPKLVHYSEVMEVKNVLVL